jgi:hypothetical protein
MFFPLLITLIIIKINALPIKATLNILQAQPQLAVAGQHKLDGMTGRDNSVVPLPPLSEIGLACADGFARLGGITKKLGDIFDTHRWSSCGWCSHELYF